MYDIDPPAPILRLDAPRKATQPTAQSDKQHLARRESPRAHIVEAIADEWARRTPNHGAGRDTMIFRMDGTVQRIRALSQADADMSGAIDAAL